MLFGEDIGNGKTKITTREGNTGILSRIKQGHTPLNDSIYNVTYNDSCLTVGGTEGEMDMDNDKYTREFHDILLFTGIAATVPEDTKDITANIVTGMPVEYFKNADNRKAYRERMLSLSKQKIIVNEKEKNIAIGQVKIFPQSAAVWKNTAKYRNVKTLVGDIGAGTFDVSIWDGLDLLDGKSFPLGVHKHLFKNLSTAMNSFLGTDYMPHDLEPIIKKNKDKVFDKKRNEHDITKIKADYIQSYYRDLVNTMNNFYKISDVDELIITGGGSYIVKQLYLDNFRNISIDCNEFVNSEVYYAVGEAKGLEC